MKRLILAAALLAGSSGASFAACTTVGTVGNIHFFTASSDMQCNDGDDLMMFIDKNGAFTSADGSLGSNNQAFNNIHVVANASVVTDGSGFANFKSVNANDPAMNTLTGFTFSAGSSTTLPDGTPFKGFDGELFRGQIDNKTNFDGTISLNITQNGGPVVPFTFTGVPVGKDFGVLGWDEIKEPGLTDTVTITAGTGGVFNQLKQLEFSVNGAVAPIPEPRTWVLLIVGFGLIALGGVRKARTSRSLEA